MDFLPWTTFARIVERYSGDRYVKSLRCAEHFRKHLSLDTSLYTLQQILSVTLFEKMAIYQALTGTDYKSENDTRCIQLTLFAF